MDSDANNYFIDSNDEGGIDLNLKGFHGCIRHSDEIPFSGEKEIDLIAMAQEAMLYLINNPRPELDYECRFGIDLMRCPPWVKDDEHEVITAGDTDLRMLIEYGYMKEMTGSDTADKQLQVSENAPCGILIKILAVR